MNDSLDRLLARNYGDQWQGVQPRRLARFEQPDLLPTIETPVPPTAVPTVAPSAPTQESAPVQPPSPEQPPAAPLRTTTELQRVVRTIRDERTIQLVTMEREAPSPDNGTRQHERSPQRSLVRPAPETESVPVREPTAPTAAILRVEAEIAPLSVPTILPVLPPALPAERAAPAPRIEVHIGRVEVHAPTPPPPPTPRTAPVRAAPRAAMPVRTLDEYLRQRNEERR